MARVHPLHLVPALLAIAHAGELAIESGPFFISHHFDAMVVTAETLPIRRNGHLPVAHIIPHGARVETGDSLLRFDGSGLDQEIERARLSIREDALTIEKAEFALRQLQEAGPMRLSSLQRAAREAQENLDHFNKTGRKVAEDCATEALRSAARGIEQHRAELARLDQVHDPERNPDEPEPLPVIRQKDVIAGGEFALRMEALDQEHRLKVLIPREADALALREKETLLNHRQAEESLRKDLDFRQAELEMVKAAASVSQRKLAELEARRETLEFKAPAPGWWFHGPLDDERPAGDGAPIATFVPAASERSLVALVPAESVGNLTKGLEGVGTFPGTAGPSAALKLSSISEIPDHHGLHRVEISAVWPEGHLPAPGSRVETRFISHRKAAAIAVPSRSLTLGPEGWTVNVKLADGKAEPRPVTPGLVSSTHTEILSGLDAGQVIVVPAEPR